jgi:hypothetical protein
VQLLLPIDSTRECRVGSVVVAGSVSCRGLALVSIPVAGVGGGVGRWGVLSPAGRIVACGGGVWWVLVGLERLVVS